jgi:hypothetical protein
MILDWHIACSNCKRRINFESEDLYRDPLGIFCSIYCYADNQGMSHITAVVEPPVYQDSYLRLLRSNA